jgi:hypothetical protein
MTVERGNLDSLLQELKSQVGRPLGKDVSFPITVSDIRKWAIAAYWPETPPRLFWDEEYAKKTRFGGIVAPEDFNPFAWPIRREGSAGPRLSVRGQFRVLNAGYEMRHLQPIRPGDVITAESILAEANERPSASLGKMVLWVREAQWTNQRGELVKIIRRPEIFY